MVHPFVSLGTKTLYPKVEAMKESTKATTASITGEEGGTVEEGGGKKEGYLS